MTGATYVARAGKGSEAKTASCTAGPKEAVMALAVKLFPEDCAFLVSDLPTPSMFGPWLYEITLVKEVAP